MACYPHICHRSWSLVVSSYVKSVNGHKDGTPRGRRPRNCRRFWRVERKAERRGVERSGEVEKVDRTKGEKTRERDEREGGAESEHYRGGEEDRRGR